MHKRTRFFLLCFDFSLKNYSMKKLEKTMHTTWCFLCCRHMYKSRYTLHETNFDLFFFLMGKRANFLIFKKNPLFSAVSTVFFYRERIKSIVCCVRWCFVKISIDPNDTFYSLLPMCLSTFGSVTFETNSI